MAAEKRNASSHLGVREALGDDPRRFALFAALRRLEALSPERPRLGESLHPRDDLLRLGQIPYLRFPRTEIAGVEERPGGGESLMQFAFGVFGPNGALPLHLTELAAERVRHADDPGFRDFVDLFHHRLISLFYRAAAQANPAIQADRPLDDGFRRCLAALVGLGPAAARDRDAVPDDAKWSRAGLLGQQTRSADALVALLEDYFETRVEYRPYRAGWLTIPDEARMRIGRGPENAMLGMSATIGGRSWQVQHAFELVVGPFGAASLAQFLPGEPRLQALRDLVRLYTHGEWEWYLRVLVAAGAAPKLQLGRGSQLGWSSWIGERASLADEVVLGGDTPVPRRTDSEHVAEIDHV